MAKKERKINDPDARLCAGLYKFFIRIMGAIIIVVLGYNTFMLGNAGYKTIKDWNNDEDLKSFVVKINTDNELYKYIKLEKSNEAYLENVKNSTGKELAIKNYVKLIILEVYLIFLILYYINIFSFLTNDNLSNPFTTKSDDYLSKAIEYGLICFAFSLFLGSMSTITFESLLIIALIRYIIRKGTAINS